MWRGWTRGGQVLEVSWPRASVGARVTYQAGDSAAERFLWFGLGLVQFFIPIGLSQADWDFGDEPQWGLDLSREFGIVVHWGQRRWQWDWPFHTILLDRSYATADGLCAIPDIDFRKMPEREDGNPFWNRPGADYETHDYTYTLRSGNVQRRRATILRERTTRGRHVLSRLGWLSRVSYSIDVKFDGEVGERSGSWKGGTVGCGHTMLPDETAIDALRRMERERKF